jgi:hypothetical protein
LLFRLASRLELRRFYAFSLTYIETNYQAGEFIAGFFVPSTRNWRSDGMIIRVVNIRDSLDTVTVDPFCVPLRLPLIEWMCWSAVVLVKKAQRYEICSAPEEMLDVA